MAHPEATVFNVRAAMASDAENKLSFTCPAACTWQWFRLELCHFMGVLPDDVELRWCIPLPQNESDARLPLPQRERDKARARQDFF